MKQCLFYFYRCLINFCDLFSYSNSKGYDHLDSQDDIELESLLNPKIDHPYDENEKVLVY